MEETGCVPGAGMDDCEENKISLAPTPTAIRTPDRRAHNLVTIPTTQFLLATNNLLGTLFANKKILVVRKIPLLRVTRFACSSQTRRKLASGPYVAARNQKLLFLITVSGTAARRQEKKGRPAPDSR